MLEARTDVARLTVVGMEGDTVRIMEDALPPVPLGDAEWGEATEDYRSFRQENPGIRCDPEPVRPRTKPPLGREFVRQVRIVLERIGEWPESGSPRRSKRRSVEQVSDVSPSPSFIDPGQR